MGRNGWPAKGHKMCRCRLRTCRLRTCRLRNCRLRTCRLRSWGASVLRTATTAFPSRWTSTRRSRRCTSGTCAPRSAGACCRAGPPRGPRARTLSPSQAESPARSATPLRHLRPCPRGRWAGCPQLRGTRHLSIDLRSQARGRHLTWHQATAAHSQVPGSRNTRPWKQPGWHLPPPLLQPPGAGRPTPTRLQPPLPPAPGWAQARRRRRCIDLRGAGRRRRAG